MEGHQLELLDDDAAMAMHDRLGHAGGAGRIDDPQRMVERHRLDRQRHVVRQHLLPGMGAHAGGRRRIAADLWNEHEIGQRGEGGDQVCHHRGAVVDLAAIAVAIDCYQHLGPDLAEAVDHRHLAHVRRAARPDRTQAGGGQEGDDGGGDIRQVAGNAVAALHAHLAQRMRQRRHLRLQRVPAEIGQRLGLAGMADRGALAGAANAGMAEYLLHVVQRGALEPARARHGAAVQHLRGGRVEAYVEIGAHGVPEGFQLGDRPLPEAVVVVKGQAALGPQPVHEARDLAAVAERRGGRPHQVPFGQRGGGAHVSSSGPSVAGIGWWRWVCRAPVAAAGISLP